MLNILRYFYGKDSYPIDAEEYCNNNVEYKEYWRSYGNLPRFIRRYEEAIYGKNPSNKEHCINNMKQNVAIIHFHIASSANDLISRIVKTPRVTTADMLSNIGLFCKIISRFQHLKKFTFFNIKF